MAKLEVIGSMSAWGDHISTYGISDRNSLYIGFSVRDMYPRVLSVIALGEATGFRFSQDGDITGIVASTVGREHFRGRHHKDPTDEQFAHAKDLEETLRGIEASVPGASQISEFTGLISAEVAKRIIHQELELQTGVNLNQLKRS